MKTLASARLIYSALLLLLASISFANSASLLSEPMQNVPETKQKPVEAEDEIEVIGVNNNFSLYYLRKQIEVAEIDFYDAFNALADNEKFKIKCSNQKATGSNIKTKVCHPQYVINRMAQEYQDAWQIAVSRTSPGELPQGASFPTLKGIEFGLKEEREASLKYVAALVEKHPELRAKLVTLNERQTILEQVKASR